ncbi:MAG: hypothetical protein QOK40_1541, partial [Miltoncostaeaceae bacterium]|nr:hypothetical protein [Miltoncostaeaceae bacterium]
ELRRALRTIDQAVAEHVIAARLGIAA